MTTLAAGRLAKEAPAMILNEILREGHDYHEFRTWLCARLADWIVHWERNNDSKKFPYDDHQSMYDSTFMRLRGVSLLKARKGQSELTLKDAVRLVRAVKAYEHCEELMRRYWEPSSLFDDIIDYGARARSLFRTEYNNLLGLAPPLATKGDEVWLLKGANTPHVLRRDKGGHHILIGEAYLHGYMNGEAFTKDNIDVRHAMELTIV
jgi:hypothetical protein